MKLALFPTIGARGGWASASRLKLPHVPDDRATAKNRDYGSECTATSVIFIHLHLRR